MVNIRLLYDNEIEDIARDKSLFVIPMFKHMLFEYPDADFEDISYTIAEHIRNEGFESLPDRLLTVPLPEPVGEPEPENVQEDYNDSIELVESEEPPAPQVTQREKPKPPPQRRINFRQIMAEAEDLGL